MDLNKPPGELEAALKLEQAAPAEGGPSEAAWGGALAQVQPGFRDQGAETTRVYGGPPQLLHRCYRYERILNPEP